MTAGRSRGMRTLGGDPCLGGQRREERVPRDVSRGREKSPGEQRRREVTTGWPRARRRARRNRRLIESYGKGLKTLEGTRGGEATFASSCLTDRGA